MFDQGRQGTCYAYMAVQLGDYFRLKNHPSRPGEKTRAENISSPGYLAYLARSACNKEGDLSSLDGGSAHCTMLVLLTENGVCSMAATKTALAKGFFSPVGFQFSSQSRVIESQMVTWAEDLFASSHDSGITSAIRQEIARAAAPLSCTGTSTSGSILLQDWERDLMRISSFEGLQKDEFLFALNRTLSNACGPNEKLRVGEPQPASFVRAGRPVDPSRSQEEVIRTVLERGYPLGIGYCAGLFRSGRVPGEAAALYSLKEGKLAYQKGCSPHASVISGMRTEPKSGRCQVLIRNSSGESCAGIHPDWECDLGQIWVDAQQLTQNTFDLLALLPKKQP